MSGRDGIDRRSGTRHVKPRTFDYVIVGAGSAGCTLARLTEDRHAERSGAGGRRLGPRHVDPFAARLGQAAPGAPPRLDVRDRTGGGTDGRRIECARGKIVGGSSSINAMAYVRGNRADYDRWASYGLPGWSYATRCRISGARNAGRRWRSLSRRRGPLVTERSRYEDPLFDAYVEPPALPAIRRTMTTTARNRTASPGCR